jgi:hypothetical protein
VPVDERLLVRLLLGGGVLLLDHLLRRWPWEGAWGEWEEARRTRIRSLKRRIKSGCEICSAGWHQVRKRPNHRLRLRQNHLPRSLRPPKKVAEKGPAHCAIMDNVRLTRTFPAISIEKSCEITAYTLRRQRGTRLALPKAGQIHESLANCAAGHGETANISRDSTSR